MYLRQFLDDRHGCASYLIADGERGVAAVIDPAIDTAQYEEVLAVRGLRLVAIFDTHTHADHVSGARRLRETWGAPIFLHENARVTYPFVPLTDGETVEVGALRVRAFHTPGHRAEMMSLLLIDPARADVPFAVCTGDSLLIGDAGRPDFGGGDAVQQERSFRRLMELEDWVIVLPGHFEGPCSATMNGVSSSTIGFERRFNPMARLSREAFVARLTSEVPPRPLNMTAIEATNRGTADAAWAMPAEFPRIETVTVDELPGRAPFAVLLDVREPAEFAAGHIPGAVNIPQADLATRLAELPRDRDLLVVCAAGRRSLKAGTFLASRGFGRVASVAGGTGAWQASGRPLATADVALPA